MSSTILPALIRRECIELDRLVQTCLNRYGRRMEFVKMGSEDILADSLAACLHSFYNGIERVFEAVVRDIDGARGRSSEWPRELLQAVSVERPGLRPAVISERTFEILEEYRAFRHIFRHLYTHHIDPARIFSIMDSLEEVWKLTKGDLMNFLDFLERAS